MKNTLLLFLALVFAFPLIAQDLEPTQHEDLLAGLQKAEKGGYTFHYVPGDPVGMRIYSLKNGLTVFLAQHTDEPKISTAIGVKTGSKNDPADNTGLSHYLEHLLFKGSDQFGTVDYAKEKVYLDRISDTYDALRDAESEAQRKAIFARIDSLSQLASKLAIPNEYDRIVGQMGAEGTNAFTSNDMTVYINQIPKNQLEHFLTLEAERFRKPVFRMFHTELETVYEEKNRAIDSDSRRAYEAMLAKLFPTHNYGQQTTLGKTDHLKRPDIKAIYDYYEARYVPNNMIIFMVGDLEFTQTIRQIEEKFGYMKPKSLQDYDPPQEEPIQEKRVVEEIGPGPASVSMAWRLPGAGHPDLYAMDVLSSLLSSDAGLIELNLLQKQKILRGGGYYNEMADYSMFQMYGMPKGDQTLEEVETLLLEELQKVAEGDFDEDLMVSIILNEEVTEKRKQESATWKLYASLWPVMSGVPYQQTTEYVERLRAVTKADVQRVAHKYLDSNGYVVAYKENGENKDLPKMDKPQITPIEINRENNSAFAERLMNSEVEPIEPQFVNFDKDFKRIEEGGVEFLYRKNEENDLFTLYYLVEMGKRHNPLLPYAINYWEYLAPEGMTPEQYKQKMFELACNSGVSVGDRQVYVYFNGPQRSFKDGLSLFVNKLLHPQADEEALENLKADIRKEREDNKKSQNSILYGGLRNLATYGKDNPFNTTINDDELDGLKSETLLGIVKSLLRYEHSVMYYGPEEQQLVYNMIQSFSPGGTPKSVPEAKRFEYVKVQKPKVYFAHYEMVQAQMMWVAPTMKWDMNGLGLTSAYEEYFSGSMHSIVFQEIRESKGLAYSAYAYLADPYEPTDPLLSIAFVGTQADKIKDAIPAMQDILMNFRKSPTAFAASKTSAIKQIRADRSVRTAPFFEYFSARRKGLTKTLNAHVFDQLQQVSLGDIEKLYASELKDLNYTLVVMGDRERVDLDYLKSLGEFEEVDLETLFGY